MSLILSNSTFNLGDLSCAQFCAPTTAQVEFTPLFDQVVNERHDQIQKRLAELEKTNGDLESLLQAQESSATRFERTFVQIKNTLKSLSDYVCAYRSGQSYTNAPCLEAERAIKLIKETLPYLDA